MEGENNVSEAPAEAKPRRRGSWFKKLLVFIVIAGVVVAGGYFANKLMSKLAKPVAVVNGEKISLAKYNERYARLVTSLESQGQSATSTEIMTAIKKQVTDDLVAETLLLQEAKKKGLTAKTDEVDAVYKQNQSSFPSVEEFNKELTKQGYTEATFKETLTTQNIIQQYLISVVDLKSAVATEEEISALYKQLVAAAPKDSAIPALKDVKTQVEAQIVQQKQQALVSKYIEDLKAKSKIEILN